MLRIQSFCVLVASSLYLSVLGAGAGQAAIIVETSQFIATPTFFNGFENITSSPNTSTLLGLTSYDDNTSYGEGGITVDEDALGGGIWLNYPSNIGGQGNYGWYPDGGDTGFTKITLTGGEDFRDIQFLAGTGFRAGVYSMAFELLENDTVVDGGNILLASYPMSWVGFSGGGFNTVEIQAEITDVPFSSSNFNGLAIDSIGADPASAVPEPNALVLLGSGLVRLGLIRRRKSASRVRVG